MNKSFVGKVEEEEFRSFISLFYVLLSPLVTEDAK